MTGYSLLTPASNRHVEFAVRPLTPIGSWVCAECHSLLPGHRLQDVRLRHTKLGAEPLMPSFNFGHQVVRRTFLEQLCAGKIDRDFEWATVFTPEGEPFEDWLIARARHQIEVRGEEDVSCDFCPTCGRTRYFASDRSYLYPAPREDIDIFGAGSSLVVTDRILQRIQSQIWPKLLVMKLPVAEEPLDGLGEIPLRKPSE